MNRPIMPKEGEYAPYYEKYVGYARPYDLEETLENQISELRSFLSDKEENWFMHGYQEGKWSPKELIGHIIDTERIFAYRSLCLARGEKGSLPGFDENAYVFTADFNSLPVDFLLDDFTNSRKSLLSMMRNIPDEALVRSAEVNGSLMSSRACLTIIAGHFIHHMHILRERY